MSIGRRPATLWALLAAPFVTAGLLVLNSGCPVLAATGLPCPTCGATRGVGLLLQGNPDFLHYNPVWAVLVMLVLAISGVGAIRLLRGERVAGPRLAAAVSWANVRSWPIPLAVSTVAIASWVTAMVNLETIRVPGT